LQDPDQDSFTGVSTVAFEVELAFERVEDRLHALAQRLEEPGAGSVRFSLAWAAQEFDPGAGHGVFEVAAVVVLVGDHDLPGPGGGQGRVVMEQVEHDLAFVGLGAGDRERDG